MFVSVINTYTCRKSLKTHASTSGSVDMHESNKRALGTKTSIFTQFVSISRILYSVHVNICFHWLSFTLKVIIFSDRVQLKIKDFQGPKSDFKYFQGLEIRLLKFKDFKAFQDTCKPLINSS